jgi:CRP/FNR family nitrogen fixation transcriptional regulator
MEECMQPGAHELRLELKHRQIVQNLRPDLPVAPFSYDENPLAMRSILALCQGSSRYRRNRLIFFEDDPADYFFFLSRGVVRTCRIFKNGKRGVVAFHVAGEFVGLDGEMTHSFCAEAATDATVLPLKRSAVFAAAIHDRGVSDFLLASMAIELRRLREHTVLISRDAHCRVATFLTDLSVRFGQPHELDLPMSHRDIADYLGLSIETVSRVITEFERLGFVARLSPRSLILKNRGALMRCMG